MKILIADDDAVSRRLMQAQLQKIGYEVITASDGLQAAAELAKIDGPRLALVDWMMPGLDGLGVCREVRERHDNLYVYMLLLTSKQSNEDVVRGLEAGADDYLTKPCNPAELKARLHTGRRILQLEDKLVEAREEMRFKATHDGLTRLWNRSAILSLLRAELSRAMREEKPVSVLLCDVDHFKDVNDTHGHLTGDEVLQEVGSRLQAAVRDHDGVGRYGGEEFLCVLPGCGASQLEERADEVRLAIGGRRFRTITGDMMVSLSVGAITIGEWTKWMTLEPFLKAADDALYRAKALGRDRVVCAESLMETAESTVETTGSVVVPAGREDELHRVRRRGLVTAR